MTRNKQDDEEQARMTLNKKGDEEQARMTLNKKGDGELLMGRHRFHRHGGLAAISSLEILAKQG